MPGGLSTRRWTEVLASLMLSQRTMKRKRPRLRSTELAITTALWAALALPATSVRGEATHSQVPSLAELVGDYHYVGNKVQDEAAIRAQVQAATADMGRFVLKRAMPRLEKSTSIPERIDLATRGSDVVITMGKYVVTVPKSGAKVNLKTPIGDTAASSFRASTATLSQVVEKIDSQKRNSFRFDDKGDLVMRVRIDNEKRFAVPVDFTLRYAKTK